MGGGLRERNQEKYSGTRSCKACMEFDLFSSGEEGATEGF